MSERREVPIPLPGTDQWASLTATWPLSDEQWEYMMGLLAVMKPGLVSDSDAREGADEQDEDRPGLHR